MSAAELFVFLQQPHIAVPIVIAAMAIFFISGWRWAAAAGAGRRFMSG